MRGKIADKILYEGWVVLGKGRYHCHIKNVDLKM